MLALRGILVGRDRESQLSGLYAGPQEGRRNINGVDVVIVVEYPSTLHAEKVFRTTRLGKSRARVFANPGYFQDALLQKAELSIQALGDDRNVSILLYVLKG